MSDASITTIPRALLPPVARELHDLLGPDALARLVCDFGGLEIRVPQQDSPTHPLARCLGPEAWPILFEHRPGEYLTIPRLAHVRSLIRRRGIIADRQAGYTANETAKRHGVTSRWVRIACARGEALNIQPDLFGDLP